MNVGATAARRSASSGSARALCGLRGRCRRVPLYRIANARVPLDLAPGPAGHTAQDRFRRLRHRRGRRAHRGCRPRLHPSRHPRSATAIDLHSGIVLARFVDVHTHIDKGHIWPRHPNPDGTHTGARQAVAADREAHWDADDVRTRMDFSLRCAYAHGSGAIRTHLDSLGKQAAISWPVFAEMREQWRDRIALQGVAIFPVELAVDDEPQFRAIVETVVRYGGILGGVTFLGQAAGPKLELALDRLFGMAIAHGLDLDLHVDESCSPDARSLDRIAAVGASSSLRRADTGGDTAARWRSRATRTAGGPLNGCARPTSRSSRLPLCNMYLQDRAAGRTPRLRGVAPLHELDAAGVAVMVASDNTRDPFYPYGDLDMLEVFREATRILHLDHSQRPWIRMLGAAAAEQMGLADRGLIAAGQNADLVLTRARTLPELVCRPHSDRAVVVSGSAIDTTLPDYRELDRLLADEASGGRSLP